MIDIENAKRVFKEYVSNYDMENKKISLKYSHTLRVVDIARRIAMSLNLSAEEVALAELCSLLHDIGRFEQAKVYDTFDDFKSIDHGDLGIKILFEDNKLRNFIENDKYDEIMRKSVYVHNKAFIPEDYTNEEKLYSKIVRDADKIDILYLTVIHDIKFNITDETISREVMECILNSKFIDRHIVKTGLDKALLDLAFVYDLNFDCSYEIIRKEKYIDKIIDSLNLKNLESKKIFNIIRDFINKNSNISEGVI